MNIQNPSSCPVSPTRDDRKSARIAAENITVEPNTRIIEKFAASREILRSNRMRQMLLGVEFPIKDDPTKVPVIFLDGEIHRQRRTAIARYFTPKAVSTRYRAVMEQCTDDLLRDMQSKGSAHLDQISFQLAVTVAGTIVGLNDSDQNALARRIDAVLSSSIAQVKNPIAKIFSEIRRRYRALVFFFHDVRPAIVARRKQRREDVISHLIDEGYTEPAILVECITYGAAGMVTTREFIVMAAWHLFENEELRERFLSGTEEDQFAILDEILRIEPVASMIYRRAGEDAQFNEAGAINADTMLAVDVRAVNSDESVTGPCPYAIDPDRAKTSSVGGSFMSFGDGSHRCPGAQVAMHETRVFLDRLMRVPGIKLERAPDMTWHPDILSYELRNAILTCDRA